MVAIRFDSREQRSEGFMLLVRQGRVRTLRREIYVCQASSLPALEAHKIRSTKVPLPVISNEVDALRDTPTTVR